VGPVAALGISARTRPVTGPRRPRHGDYLAGFAGDDCGALTRALPSLIRANRLAPAQGDAGCRNSQAS
jgi:hypothetical protein